MALGVCGRCVFDPVPVTRRDWPGDSRGTLVLGSELGSGCMVIGRDLLVRVGRSMYYRYPEVRGG